MKTTNAMLVVTALLGGCVVHDTAVVPVWDDAPTPAARAAWTTVVQEAIDEWQLVLGERCAFPIYVADDGATVSLVAKEAWPYPALIGRYSPGDGGSVVVKGDDPRGPGVPDTVAHELGHATGLPHSPDRGSIMYNGSGLTVVPTAIDGRALRAALGCD